MPLLFGRSHIAPKISRRCILRPLKFRSLNILLTITNRVYIFRKGRNSNFSMILAHGFNLRIFSQAWDFFIYFISMSIHASERFLVDNRFYLKITAGIALSGLSDSSASGRFVPLILPVLFL